MDKRTALITGSSRGIGAAIAGIMRKAGIEVLSPGRRELDLLSDSSIDLFLSGLKDRPIDIIVNNAGINNVQLLEDLSDKNMEDTLQVNLLAPLRLIRGIVPGMIRRGYGRIVNISSIWGMITKPGRLPYTVSKSGLDGMTRTLALELAPHNILVNAVAPGYVDTELTRKNNTTEQIEVIQKTIPLNRLADPEEIAQLVLFLSSEKNSYMTGQVVIADGGFTCL